MENKYDLSVVIPARNEMFLHLTIEDILKNKRGKTQIIVGLDENWADPPIKDHPDLIILKYPISIGQRAITNRCVKLSKAKYVMKVDAHCAFDEGFDIKLMADMQDNWTVVPKMYNLHAFDWVCQSCKHRQYQGPTPKECPKCKGKMIRDIIWKPRPNTKSTAFRFDTTLHFQYWSEYKKKQIGDLVETLSLQGSCFMLSRKKYWELNICDEAFGSWGQQGVEVALKTWLSGGRVIVNKKTWYAHMFRTQGGDFGFPYPISGRQVDMARKYSRELFFGNKWEKQIYPLSWLLEKFKPVPEWHEEKGKEMLNKVNEAGKKFYHKKAQNREKYFMTFEVICVVCGKKYSVKPFRLEKTKCCSKECSNILVSRNLKGKIFTEDHKQKISQAMQGENHRLWKGDEVSYKTLHQWVQRYKGVANKCQNCGSEQNVEWANKSRQYKRDTSDWIQLCKKCHWKYDNLSRAIVYYTDNQINLKLGHAVRKLILKANLPIVSCSLKPMNFGKNIYLPLKRGYLTMTKQQLAALEASDADIIFFCEHDCFYHPSHFEFTPPKKDVYYYNTNWWRVRIEDGHALHYDTEQVNFICAYRELLLKHYREKVRRIEKEGFSMRIGFEPGCNPRKERIDNYKAERWQSKYPNLDLRHDHNLTKSRWSKDQFRNKKSIEGWTESNIFHIKGWDFSKGLLNPIALA